MDIKYIHRRFKNLIGTCFSNSHDKICFLTIPKNASTSIRQALNLNINSPYYTKFDDYFKFCVFREPYSRFLSSYAELLYRNEDHCNKTFWHITDPEHQLRIFINEIENDLFDPHISMQSYWIHGLKVDMILVFERLKVDFEIMLNKLYKNNFLTFENDSSENPFKYNIIKTADQIIKSDNKLYNKILDYYAIDFDVYYKIINKNT